MYVDGVVGELGATTLRTETYVCKYWCNHASETPELSNISKSAQFIPALTACPGNDPEKPGFPSRRLQPPATERKSRRWIGAETAGLLRSVLECPGCGAGVAAGCEDFSRGVAADGGVWLGGDGGAVAGWWVVGGRSC